MRVHVYHRTDGMNMALIIPGRAAHLPPVVVMDTDREAFKADLAAAIERNSPQAMPPQESS